MCSRFHEADLEPALSHWSRTYFGPLYGEIYRRFLMPPDAAEAEAEFVADVLTLEGKRVLDLACGYGRHARQLAKRARVVGLDFNRDYLTQAKRGARGRAERQLQVVGGDMRHLPFGPSSFNAVLLLFNSFGYFTGNALAARAGAAPKQQVWKLPNVFYERRLVAEDFGRFGNTTGATGAKETGNPEDENESVLREVSRVLSPGGSFMLELPNPKALLHAIATHPRRHVVTPEYEIEEEYEWNEGARVLQNRSRFRIKSRVEEGAYAIRLYEPGEIRALLTEHRLKPVKSFGSYAGERFSATSSDILLIHARKTSE